MFKKLKDWYNRHFALQIRLDREHSTVVISPALWASIIKDHPTDTQFNVLFQRLTDVRGRIHFVMFFNPDWQKHGISNPRMIMTIPVTHSESGRVGFQTIQPSVELIFVMYGINDDTAILNVSREHINGEPYYRILRP